jgi:DNA polymerase III gamma/tau subunit
VPEALETMAGWLRDLIVIRHDAGKVINIDRTEGLQRAADRLSVGDLMDKIDAIRQAQESIDANGNLRLTLEAMVLRLSQDCAKGKRLYDV